MQERTVETVGAAENTGMCENQFQMCGFKCENTVAAAETVCVINHISISTCSSSVLQNRIEEKLTLFQALDPETSAVVIRGENIECVGIIHHLHKNTDRLMLIFHYRYLWQNTFQ